MLIKQRDRLFEVEPPEGLKLAYMEGKGLGLFADRNFEKGEDVISFGNTLVTTPEASAEAVQVGEDTWIDTEWLVSEAFINHSCEPNTRLDFRPDKPTSAYVATRDIKKDEEISFDYLTTDWDMGEGSFTCTCGSPHCYGEIRGLKYLTKDQQEKLKPFILPFLLEKIS